MAGSEAEDQEVAAGDFSSWLRHMQSALRGERSADVPCGGCTACCTSSQFVTVAPDEAATLSRIPAGLLFPAPRLPRGHVLLGYDERGHCPMLVEGRCSIYEHRPRACRMYDCRVFAAADVAVDDAHGLIDQRVSRWRFTYASAAGREEHEAVRAASRYVRDRQALIADDVVPANATQLAVLAIGIHQAFRG